MKILNSTPISSFGGINYVLKEIEDQGIGLYLNRNLPNLAKQSRFSWKDIIYSYWSVFFCGGNCAEDLSKNLHTALKDNPFLNLPSPDRILERLKSLSTPHIKAKTSRSTKIHQLSPNSCLNQLNIGLLKKLRLIPTDNNTLDYDNTFVFAEKADSAYTYKQRNGYCPGVGLIGNNIVYVENRNGNSNPEALQLETLKRMFDLLTKNKIHVSAFRADAASYSVLIINEIQKHVDKFYIRARMSEVLD
jgi:hypothetical protein